MTEILVRQMSGLGNQLFQYAAGLYYATKYHAGLTILIDPEKDPGSLGSPRPFQLDAFEIGVPMRRPSPIERLFSSQSPKLKPAAALARSVAGAKLWSEPKFRVFYPDLPYGKLPASVYLRAYWQAAGYVEGVEKQLRLDFRLKEEPTPEDARVLDAIAACRCPVSVHVRCGDYLLTNLALPADYYRTAWQTILAGQEGVEFFVFSDHMDFARAHLPAGAPCHFVSHNDGWTAYRDLRLMAACRHHILANSTFSWWGAWLNPSPAKVVIAPRYWSSARESFYPDLCPASWRLLDNLDYRPGTVAAGEATSRP